MRTLKAITPTHLRYMIEDAKCSQREFAERFGIHESNLSAYLSGSKHIPESVMWKLVKTDLRSVLKAQAE